MNKGHVPRFIFREKPFHIRDRHKSREQLLLFPNASDERWLMHQSKMNTRFVAADSSVECRLTMEEIDRKPKLIPIKLGRCPQVRHKHHRYSLRQSYGGRSRPDRSGSFFQPLLEFSPTRVAVFQRDDFLRL